MSRHKAKSQRPLTTIQIGASIRAEHVKAGLSKSRQKCKNHDSEQVDTLLSVPRYANLLDDSGHEDSLPDQDGASSSLYSARSILVASRTSWRCEMNKWMEDERESDENEGQMERQQGHTTRTRWLPHSLGLLFGGTATRPVQRPRCNFTHETLLMELMAAECEDEIPDDGELEGSGDDYA